jgi:hypothetical protein
MTGAVHPPRAGEDRVTFAYDSVLGFGIKMASNIAQRFADFLVHIFRKALAPAVVRLAARFCGESSEFESWWEHRQSLSEGLLQAVLCCIFMYCDDPCVLCVGPDMAHEALKVWTWMSKSGNTMMAIPEKRSFGLSAKWIGIKFFTGLGIIAVTSQKVLRACAQITEASNDSLTRDQYRSFIGFLEHTPPHAARDSW